jgi:hypothetical protein
VECWQKVEALYAKANTDLVRSEEGLWRCNDPSSKRFTNVNLVKNHNKSPNNGSRRSLLCSASQLPCSTNKEANAT